MIAPRSLLNFSILLTISGLVSCAPMEPNPAGGDASEPRARVDVGVPGDSGYRASGNEPFWLLTFDGGTMNFFELGAGDTIRVAQPAPERTGGMWRFVSTTGDDPFLVEVREVRCNDDMSGRPFPHTVTVAVQGRDFAGCGGDTESLLTGAEWIVSRLEGSDSFGQQRPTLHFTAGGELTGTGGCNRYLARYEITGEGIAIGPAAATRMACVEPMVNEREVRFFTLLEQVSRFDISADGALELHLADEPVIVARR